MSYEILGYGYAWWSSDPLPPLAPISGFRVVPTSDAALIARMAQLDRAEVVRRIDRGNRPYIGYLHDEPIAYGWSATETGGIYEMDLVFEVPAGTRYFWDFVTLPSWRGRGVYPRMLQAILTYEQSEVQRFWISHDADNDASRHGITKAGFQTIEALVMTPDGELKILPIDGSVRAQVSPMGLRLGLLQ